MQFCIAECNMLYFECRTPWDIKSSNYKFLRFNKNIAKIKYYEIHAIAKYYKSICLHSWNLTILSLYNIYQQQCWIVSQICKICQIFSKILKIFTKIWIITKICSFNNYIMVEYIECTRYMLDGDLLWKTKP